MTALVAWSGTTASLAALDWAIAREYQADRHVVLCQVVGPDEAGPGSLDAVEEFARRLRQDRSGIRFSAEVLTGDPVEQLERRCADGPLLVLGTDTRNEHPRRFEHSLGMRLALRRSTAMVIVPIDARRGASGVVVGVDGSSSSLAALEFAAEEAELREETLVVLQAWSLRPIDEDRLDDERRFTEESNRHRAALEESLTGLRARFRELPIELRFVHGPTVWGLLTTSRKAALLVLGVDEDPAHGSGGRVEHAVLLALHMPVALIPDRSALIVRSLLTDGDDVPETARPLSVDGPGPAE